MRIAAPTTVLATLALVTAGLLVGPAQATGRTPTSGAAPTHRIVVRPVDRQGNAVSGWTVTRQSGPAVSCQGSAAGAVSRNILECFPTADYLPACWKSHHHTTLCLRDARKHVLVRVTYSGTWGTTRAPRRPSPLDLVLGHGQVCSLRIGGAWAVLPTHPHWQGFYACTNGDVYGPPKGDGINRSQQPWSVHLWKNGTRHDVVVRTVAKAFYVGSHA